MRDFIDDIKTHETEISNPSDIRFETTQENLNYTLSKEDFEEYFSWNELYQNNIWNCWLISPIMSLVEFWDYEKLIRTSVKKNEKWFIISLPLWSPEPHISFISFKELNQVQRYLWWYSPVLVSWKQWIQALMLAYWKMFTWKNQFDYNNFERWRSSRVFYDLVYGINVYETKRTIFSYDTDPVWAWDQLFLNQLYDILENFDKKTDMISLAVCLDPLTKFLSHYSMTNHEISVKKVRKDNWTLIITVGNSADDLKDHDITFRDLMQSCGAFSLWTKKNKSWLKKSKESYIWKRKYIGSTDIDDINEIKSVNQIVQLHWKEKEALREARWDIIVTDIVDNTMNVSSYGFDTKLEERDWIIVVSVWTNELSINKWLLSNKYEYEEEVIANKNYPFYLYWAKIANFVNMMRKLYINPKKWDKQNKKTFCLIDWCLQFDDDSNTFEWRDKSKRKIKEKLGDDYIKCLKDWESLWIKSSDNKTQQKIVNFLNQLVRDNISE